MQRYLLLNHASLIQKMHIKVYVAPKMSNNKQNLTLRSSLERLYNCRFVSGRTPAQKKGVWDIIFHISEKRLGDWCVGQKGLHIFVNLGHFDLMLTICLRWLLLFLTILVGALLVLLMNRYLAFQKFKILRSILLQLKFLKQFKFPHSFFVLFKNFFQHK